MKLIIAGGRNLIVSYDCIRDALDRYNLWSDLVEIIEGGANGIDRCAKQYAIITDTPYKTFKANWGLHGKAAGPIRNRQMAEYADALLLIWDGESKGSANMKSCMESLKKPIYEVILKKGLTTT